jgi:hypothetical protein
MSDNRKEVGASEPSGEPHQERAGEPSNTVPFGPERYNTANMLPPVHEQGRRAYDAAVDAMHLQRRRIYGGMLRGGSGNSVIVPPEQPPDNPQPVLSSGGIPVSAHGTLTVTTEVAKAADAKVLPKKSRSRRSATNATQRLVIRNRQHVVATSTLIISALQEALDYDPVRHHNQPPPALRIEDPHYLKDIRALIVELKRLNELLEIGNKSPAER